MAVFVGVQPVGFDTATETILSVQRAMSRVPAGVLLGGAKIITSQWDRNFDLVSTLVPPLSESTVKRRDRSVRRRGIRPVADVDTPLRQWVDSIHKAATALYPGVPGSAFKQVGGRKMTALQFGIADEANGVMDPITGRPRPSRFMLWALGVEGPNVDRTAVLSHSMETATLEADLYIKENTTKWINHAAQIHTAHREQLRSAGIPLLGGL